jgi:hypothetical protein
MQQNVGRVDRILRIALGISLLAGGVYFHSWWGLLGIVPIATAVIGWCPAYTPFGISSDDRK